LDYVSGILIKFYNLTGWCGFIAELL